MTPEQIAAATAELVGDYWRDRDAIQDELFEEELDRQERRQALRQAQTELPL